MDRVEQGFESASLYEPRGLMPVFAVQGFINLQYDVLSFDKSRLKERLKEDPEDMVLKSSLVSVQIQSICMRSMIKTLKEAGVEVSIHPPAENVPSYDTEFDKRHMLKLITDFSASYKEQLQAGISLSMQSDASLEAIAKQDAILNGLAEFIRLLLQLMSEFDDHFANDTELIEEVLRRR